MKTPKRLFDFIALMAEHRPLDNSVNSKVAGKWVGLSTQEVKEQGDRCSAGLLALGVMPGDKIAIISSTNRT